MDKTIIPKCGHCGSTEFRYPRDRKTDNLVTCLGCGATWNYNEFKRVMLKKVKDTIKQTIRNFARGNPGGKRH